MTSNFQSAMQVYGANKVPNAFIANQQTLGTMSTTSQVMADSANEAKRSKRGPVSHGKLLKRRTKTNQDSLCLVVTV